jgi:acetyltransferase-like isoleucine patch superfamily enzyme
MIRSRRMLLTKAVNILYSRIVRHRFKSLGSSIDWRVEIVNPQFITIGRAVALRPFTWLYAITQDQGVDSFQPSIEIGDATAIGRFCHITASRRVVIEPNVLIGENILITDSTHSYEDVTKPIIYQRLTSAGELSIGEGTWVGDGARIVGPIRVGRNCVIATNAFVNRDVPDFCVVAGSPARVVKRYDAQSESWISVKPTE